MSEPTRYGPTPGGGPLPICPRCKAEAFLTGDGLCISCAINEAPTMSSPDHSHRRALADAKREAECFTDWREDWSTNLARAYLARDAEVKRLREALVRVPDVAYEVATGLGYNREEALEIAAGILCAALTESTEASDE